MKILPIEDVQKCASDLENLLKTESEIILTHECRPVARLCPLGSESKMKSLKAFRDSMPYQEIPTEVLLAQDREDRP